MPFMRRVSRNLMNIDEDTKSAEGNNVVVLLFWFGVFLVGKQWPRHYHILIKGKWYKRIKDIVD